MLPLLVDYVKLVDHKIKKLDNIVLVNEDEFDHPIVYACESTLYVFEKMNYMYLLPRKLCLKFYA